ncbi:MAG TPA: hypothetical protein VN030_10165 [Cellvibrio sp.]|nr:hypothetical protein [Cellvibrio sp.]
MQEIIFIKAQKMLPWLLAMALSACGGSDNKIIEKAPVAKDPVVTDPEPAASGARLLITKPGAQDNVLVFDLDENKKIAEVSVAGTISGLYASPSYRYAIATQGTAGIVNFIDSGVEWESHGDHGHLHLDEPGLLSLQLAGSKPGHVTKNGDQIAIFFDGQEGVPAAVRTLTETSMAAGEILAEYFDNIHQHGAAQAWDKYLITTARDGSIAPATTLPSMVRVSEREGSHFHEKTLVSAPEFACPGLHGSAQNIGFIAFGCNDGVLLFKPDGEQFPAGKIANTTRISSLFSHPNVVSFVGAGRNSNSDPMALFAVNPAIETIAPIAYSRTPRAYAFAKEGELFLILDTEGGLTALDTHTWAQVGARLQVTAAAEGAGQVSRLTVSAEGDKAYVADIGAQKILVVDVSHWVIEKAATINLDFAPGMILWLGSSVGGGADKH